MYSITKHRFSRLLAFVALAAFAPCAIAAPTETSTATWHAQTLSQALVNMALFALVGILMAVLGYKIFDKCTPGDMHKEILENRNVAAAIVAGAVILGVSVIIAASMIG